jgi:benzoylformate decarboxylase
MSGKRAFLDLLKQEGVKVMFGNPGTTELPLMDAFAVEDDIRYILGLQEAAARQRHGHALRRDEGECAGANHRRSARP